MIPAVPADRKVRVPIELKVKPNCRFDPRRRVFESDSGEKFSPHGDLPKKSRIVYTVPSLAKASEDKLSEYELELRRYLQIVLPEGESPAEYLGIVRAWPCVEEAHLGPEVSLPSPL
jgi:hypothetical protein